MQTQLISILIANYNNGQFISETLDSVINQTYSNWEIIIVDDASRDNSIEIIENYIATHPQSKIELYKNNSNYGCGRTKRKCVDIARGDYFAFLDPEDTIENNTLELLLSEYDKKSECGIIYTTHYLCNSKLEPQSISTWPGKISDGASHLTSKSGHISAFALCKKTVYDQTLGIDPKFKVSEDQDLYFKMEEAAPVYYYDVPLYYYRKHNENISWTNDIDKRLANGKWMYTSRKDAYFRRKRNRSIAENFTFSEFQRFKLSHNLNLAIFYYKNNNKSKFVRYILKSFKYFVFDRRLSILRTLKHLVVNKYAE